MSVILTVSCPGGEGDVTRLKEIAKAHNISVSEYVWHAIKAFDPAALPPHAPELTALQKRAAAAQRRRISYAERYAEEWRERLRTAATDMEREWATTQLDRTNQELMKMRAELYRILNPTPAPEK